MKPLPDHQDPTGVYEIGLPAVMAAAQALAESEGISVNQSILRDAETMILAAICKHESDTAKVCNFWKGHEGVHSYELIDRAAKADEYENLLSAAQSQITGPFAELIKEALS